MPGGQDPALLMIRCSVCICATRRGDDSSVLVTLVRRPTRPSLSRWLPVHQPHCRVSPTCTYNIRLSLSPSAMSLIHLHFAIVSQPTTLTVPLGRTLGAKERGTMARKSLRVLHHSLRLSLSLFLYQKWEGKETVNGRKRKRNKKNANAQGR